MTGYEMAVLGLDVVTPFVWALGYYYDYLEETRHARTAWPARGHRSLEALSELYRRARGSLGGRPSEGKHKASRRRLRDSFGQRKKVSRTGGSSR